MASCSLPDVTLPKTLLPEGSTVSANQESQQNDNGTQQVVVCSKTMVREAEDILRRLNETCKIITCSDNSIFEQPSQLLLSFTTMYLIVDSSLAKILLADGRLHDDVHKFFKAVKNSSNNNDNKRNVYVMNKFDVEDRMFCEILYQLPGGCTHEIKDILVTTEPQSTKMMELDSKSDDGEPPPVEETPQTGPSGVSLSSEQENNDTGEMDIQQSGASNEDEDKPTGSSSVNCMFGSRCTMNIMPSSNQLVIARQDGRENTVNIKIEPSPGTSQLIIIMTTDPNSPELEELLVQEIDAKKEVLNIRLKSCDAQIVSVRKGSVIIEIEVKPGQTMGSEWIESVAKTILQSDLKTTIPEGTQLHLDIESNLVVSIEGRGQNVDIVSTLRNVLQDRFVDRNEYEIKVKELQAAKHETIDRAISLGTYKETSENSAVPIEELKQTLECAVTNGIESKSGDFDCIGIAVSLIDVVANLCEEDPWTYARKHPQLFSVGGLFYRQVERDIGLSHETHFQLPSFAQKVFLYNGMSKSIELCVDPHTHYPISPDTEIQMNKEKSFKKQENITFWGKKLKRVLRIEGRSKQTGMPELQEIRNIGPRDNDSGLSDTASSATDVASIGNIDYDDDEGDNNDDDDDDNDYHFTSDEDDPDLSSSTRQERMESLMSQLESMGLSDEEQEDKGPKRGVIYDRGSGAHDLNLRDYQLELAENAVQGRNTIICAPTGSGKTRVSLYLILKHLEQEESDKKRKVVFLARTVPLVTQQFNACRHFLAQKYKVMKLTGEDEGSMYLHQLLKQFDILVMTPQILMNQLKGEKIKSLSVFSMIVLDECHHTRKGEPYNHVMLSYLKEKHNVTKKAQKGSASHLPQIVGLTASVGVEKATADDEAVNNILSLMASMDTPYLSTVETHIDELRRIVPIPEENTYSLKEDRNDPARKVIENAMQTIEDMMLEFVVLNDKTVDSLLMKRPRERSSQPYGQWAVMIKNAAQMVETGKSDGVFGVDVDEDRAEKARSLFVLSDQLLRYNAALEVHNKVRIKDVIQYLTKELGHICLRRNRVDVHVRCERQLQDLFSEIKMQLMIYEQNRGSDRRHTNPNLTVLATKLQELVKEKGPDSRTIIFVRTRATCEALVNWLNEDEHIPPELRNLQASIFTGAGAKEQEGGMTQNEQEKVLSKFKAGTVKVLVATSVAEEGLDIPECNIILRYDHVGNEITTLQTRGRSRKAGGTSVLLGSTRTCQKEMLNVARADMMNRAVMDIKNKPHDRILRIIIGYQEQILNEEAIKEMVRSQKNLQKVATRFTLLCSTCRNFCVAGNDLRLLGNNQHIVMDKKFRERVNLHRFRNPNTQYADIKITGSIQCQKCHGPWGVMFIYKEMSFISLAIKYFNVMNQDTQDQLHFKSWKNFPYRISEMTNAEIRTYSGAPDQTSSDEDDDFGV